VLAVLNLYRILVPLVLLGLYSWEVPALCGLFRATVLWRHHILSVFRLGSVVLVRRRMASANVQTILQATVDMLVLVLLLHSCGGVASGLGVLFLVPVGALAFLLPPRSALFLAAVAAIAVLADTIWQQLGGTTDINSYATAGLLGAVLFVSAGARPRLPPAECAKARRWFARKTSILRILQNSL